MRKKTRQNPAQPDAKPTASPTERLARYRQKRHAGGTPEPFVASSHGKGVGHFVVHQHKASHLHFDLRLEHAGVLVSWAVPKGPSLDPADKRMAVHVEDHPLAYGNFEGVIPSGNYGAGNVIVWDRGAYTALEPMEEGFHKGKLLFEMHGYKLRGVFTLVRTHRNERQWLLIKKPDGFARPASEGEISPVSVLSGLTVFERDAPEKVIALPSGLPNAKREPPSPMLAETAERPFSKQGWLFEPKFDGYRLLASLHNKNVTLRYRRGLDASAGFPEITLAMSTWPFTDLVVDGEVVVLDERGMPSFQGLQSRVQITNRAQIEQASLTRPATLFVFDILELAGKDLRKLPLSERKIILEQVAPKLGPVRLVTHIDTHGESFFDAAQKLGLEGIMAKRQASTYVSRRSQDWLKMRVQKTADVAVVGFTRGKGVREELGALHLATYDKATQRYEYAGRVGTGFTDKLVRELTAKLTPDIVKTALATGENLIKSRQDVWVTPKLVAEVRYTEWTRDGSLRHPVLLRIRTDKAPEDCERPSLATVATAEPPKAVEVEDEPRTVPYSNLKKVFWPEERYTKGDLIAYHEGIAPYLLPYLKDRPLVLTRYPDGIAGKSFFQKDAPAFVPSWIRRERMWSEHASRDIDYFIADDLETLLYLVNLGTIPLHIWSSRVTNLQKPDFCILDLDPKQAPFQDVITIAKAIHGLLDDIALPSFIKTSGATGLHILIPLAGCCTYEQSKTLGELLANIIVQEHNTIATTERALRGREGKVYIDYLQNGHGKTIVSPFSVRPLPGAPVSMPLRWSDVNNKLDPKAFTIKNAKERMDKLGDPNLPVIHTPVDLVTALGELHKKL